MNLSSLIKRNVKIAYLDNFLPKSIGLESFSGFRCKFQRTSPNNFTHVSNNLGYTMLVDHEIWQFAANQLHLLFVDVLVGVFAKVEEHVEHGGVETLLLLILEGTIP